MTFLRITGKVFLILAFVALAYDGARMVASPGSGLLLTSMSTHVRALDPEAQTAFQAFIVKHTFSYLWTGVLEPLLVIPVSILFGFVGTVLFLAGYRRPLPVIIDD